MEGVFSGVARVVLAWTGLSLLAAAVWSLFRAGARRGEQAAERERPGT